MASLAPVAGFLRMEVRSRLLGERRPLLAGYKLTHRCNLTCVQCPFWKQPSEELPYEGACDVMERLHEAGARLLVLEGGEPLLWRDGERGFADLVRHAKGLFWSVGVTTNGTLPIPAEPDVVWVSIDGLAETTRELRGDIFDRQMRNIAASRHPRLFANITISSRNVDEVPDLVAYLKGKVRGVTLQFYYPFDGRRELLVPPAEREAVLDRLIEMRRQGYPLLDSPRALESLKRPGWRCHSWLVASAEPDGTITQGCYLKGRAEANCALCGFAAHVEMSLAHDLHPAAMLAGLRIFGLLPGIN